MQAELKLLGITNVGIHNLSPGMVTTELLMAGESTPLLGYLTAVHCTSRVQCSPLCIPCEGFRATFVNRLRVCNDELKGIVHIFPPFWNFAGHLLSGQPMLQSCTDEMCTANGVTAPSMCAGAPS